MKEESENAIKTILNHSNVMNPSYNLGELMNEMVTKEHRTIQQTFIKEIHNFLVEYSKVSYDLRNEEAIKFAKSIEETNFPFI